MSQSLSLSLRSTLSIIARAASYMARRLWRGAHLSEFNSIFFEFSPNPISPICRTPLSFTSRNVIRPLFSLFLNTPTPTPFLPYVAHHFLPYLGM